MKQTSARTAGVIVLTAVALLALSAGLAQAREQQLAGIRLGQHAINLLDVYGQPDGIVVGEGPEAAAPTELQMGMMPGMMPGAPSPLMAPPTAMPGMAPMPGMEGPMGAMPPGPGAFPGAPPMPGMEAMPGMPGAPGAVGVTQAPFPLWAMAVWVETGPGEVQWIYNKGPVVLGFVLDRDGYINTIVVVGEDCNYARTALWRPHQYVKLGDDFKRVLYRYGYPSELMTFDSTGPGEAAPGTGQVTVSFAGTSRVFSRDVILRYTEANNIAFTLHNMKVTRIHIWR